MCVYILEHVCTDETVLPHTQVMMCIPIGDITLNKCNKHLIAAYLMTASSKEASKYDVGTKQWYSYINAVSNYVKLI